jgi:flagellin
MATDVASQTGLFSAASSSSGVLTLTGLTDGSALPAVTVTLEVPPSNAVTGVNTLDFNSLSLVEGDRITLTIAGGTQVQGAIGSAGIDTLLTSMATDVAAQTGLFSNASSSSGVLTLTGLTDGSAMAGITVTLESYASTTTIADISLLTSDNAASALTTIDQAIHDVSDQRSLLGAFQNRLSHATSNLSNMASNTESARSVIADADYAKESSRLAKAQILQQAGTAMLAQANSMAQSVLSLLK